MTQMPDGFFQIIALPALAGRLEDYRFHDYRIRTGPVIVFFLAAGAVAALYFLSTNPMRRYCLSEENIDQMAEELRLSPEVTGLLYKNMARKLVAPEKSLEVIVDLADTYEELKESLGTEVAANTATKLMRRNALEALEKGRIDTTCRLLKSIKKAEGKIWTEYGVDKRKPQARQAVLEAMVLAELGHIAYLKLAYRRAAAGYHAAAVKIDDSTHPSKAEFKAKYLVLAAIAHHTVKKFTKTGQAIEAALTAYCRDLLPDNPIYRRLIIIGMRNAQLLRTDEAHAVFSPMVRRLTETANGGGEAWLNAYFHLAEAYDADKRASESEPLRLKIIEILETLGQEDGFPAICAMNDLALCYYMQGKWDQAMGTLNELLERIQNSSVDKDGLAEGIAENMSAVTKVKAYAQSPTEEPLSINFNRFHFG